MKIFVLLAFAFTAGSASAAGYLNVVSCEEGQFVVDSYSDQAKDGRQSYQIVVRKSEATALLRAKQFLGNSPAQSGEVVYSGLSREWNGSFDGAGEDYSVELYVTNGTAKLQISNRKSLAEGGSYQEYIFYRCQ